MAVGSRWCSSWIMANTPLPRQDAFAFQQFHRGRDLPHVGEGQLFEGHEFVGVEGIQPYSPDNFGGDQWSSSTVGPTRVAKSSYRILMASRCVPA